MITVLSLGAGVQSTTLALMAAHGEITPMPDCAIFADTGGEAAATYRHLDELEADLPFPVLRVSRSHLGDNAVRMREDGAGYYVVIPAYIGDHAHAKMITAGCSKDWKTRPVARHIRQMIGPEKTARAIQWLGITTDEAHRMKPHESRWIENRWPLIDLGISRTDCLGWLHRHGYPQPPKSSCVWCAFRGKDGFSRLTTEERTIAASVDSRIRHAVSDGRGELYLRRDLLPFDAPTGAETEQGDLFGNECEGVCGV